MAAIDRSAICHELPHIHTHAFILIRASSWGTRLAVKIRDNPCVVDANHLESSGKRRN